MTFVQFSFLLPQCILGGLLFWKLCVVRGFYHGDAPWYYRVCVTVCYLVTSNSLWIYTFMCIYSGEALPYPSVMITTSLLASLVNMAIPGAWNIAASTFQRKAWQGTSWLVSAMVVFNMGLFVHEGRKVSRAQDLKIAQQDLEIRQLKHKRAQMLVEDEQGDGPESTQRDGYSKSTPQNRSHRTGGWKARCGR
jgi:hypothetical protein